MCPDIVSCSCCVCVIDPELESKLDRMFSGAVALGENTWTPSTLPPTVSEEVEGDRLSLDDVEDYLNESGASDETQRAPAPTTQTPGTRKKKKSANEMIAEAVSNIVTSYESIVATKANKNSKHESLSTALHALETIPEIYDDRSTEGS